MPTTEQLVTTYLAILKQHVSSKRIAPATREWYFFQFRHVLAAVDPDGVRIAERNAEDLMPEDLGGTPYTYHCARAIRRLFKWAADSGKIPVYRFGEFHGPPCGRRERTLTVREYRNLIGHATPALRLILRFLRKTFARPGEMRLLIWANVNLEESVILLNRFKAKDRRRDGVLVRRIPLTDSAVRILREHRRKRPNRPEDFVFLNCRGQPWTRNALRLAFSKAAKAAGINGVTGEIATCYTIRHTGATEATRLGITDRRLADILGHANTRTTARYQHLGTSDLVAAMEIATGGRGRRRVS